MFSNLMSWFGRPDPKQAAKDAIIVLRQQLEMVNKKEQYLEKRAQEEKHKAKINSVSNKKAAMAALKKKKLLESQAEQLDGTKMQLEMQIQILESANLNAETFAAMQQASQVLKIIHGRMPIAKAENIIADLNEATATQGELDQVLSNDLTSAVAFDPDELETELAELEQEVLDDRLRQARHVPAQHPVPQGKLALRENSPIEAVTAADDDESAQIARLQAEMAM